MSDSESCRLPHDAHEGITTTVQVRVQLAREQRPPRHEDLLVLRVVSGDGGRGEWLQGVNRLALVTESAAAANDAEATFRVAVKLVGCGLGIIASICDVS